MPTDTEIIRINPNEQGATRAQTEMNNKFSRGLRFHKIVANEGKVWIFMVDPDELGPLPDIPEPPPH